MRWPDDLVGWPHQTLSRQITCRPHRWHVQETAPNGPTLILLHGAGGSTHSMRGLITALASEFHVVAIDLPGHGLTRLGARHRSGLRHMTDDLRLLIEDQGWRPQVIVGHSAGGAVALNVSRQSGGNLPVIGLNPALSPFKGLAGWLFPAMAKVLAFTPFTVDLVSGSVSRPDRVRSLIAGTGSKLTEDGLALYQRLVADRDHLDGTLLMMAQWDLDPLLSDLGGVRAPVLLLCGDDDRIVPPSVSEAAAPHLRNARLTTLPQLGHLMHEEDPDRIRDHIAAFVYDLPDQDLSGR